MHPRFRLFPFQPDYAAQANVFCPHLNFVAKPGYRSGVLNVDEYGFRRQFDGRGREIRLEAARQAYAQCDVLLGNSTSFGVSVSGDERTLKHLVQEEDVPCINLSIRGATMQQELAAYMVYRRFLPKPRRIVLLTGICDASLTVQPEDLWSEAVGGVHAMATYVEQFHVAANPGIDLMVRVRSSFMAWAEQQFMKSVIVQKVFLNRYRLKEAPAPAEPVSQAKVLELMPGVLARMAGAVEQWGILARGEGVPVHVVLQPVIGWTAKGLHPDERECVEADAIRYPGIGLYTQPAVHAAIAGRLDEACREAGLAFHDANQWFEGAEFAGQRLFSDICHLTDEGTAALAGLLERHGAAPRTRIGLESTR